jgi:lipid-A-disaccharide synthase
MKIALVAGEASGDLLAAELMVALKMLHPNAHFIGLGGAKMQAQGLNSWFDYKTLSVMGFVEVLKHLPALLKLRKNLLHKLIAEKPDVLIGIDAPDFNLGLEKKCKQAGMTTVHFVSPSIWAWRQKRAAKMVQSSDLVLCLFPMEPPIYARYGVNAQFIGHPLADNIALHPDRQQARQQLGLQQADDALAILPGSRLSEIDRLLPTFISAAHLLHRAFPHLQFLIPAANAQCHAAINRHVHAQALPNARILDGQSQAAILASHAVLLASGTATLETMLCKRAMVVSYKISPITYFLVKLFGLIKVNSYSLPNVLSGENLVPELMQEQCTPEALAEALTPFISNPQQSETLYQRFLEIHLQLRKNAAQQAAHAILTLLDSKHR